MADEILPIADSEIDEVIKIAADGVPLDPNKTQGRPFRALLKKIRDRYNQEIAKVRALIEEAEPPAGVSWITAPGAPAVTNVGVTETTSAIDNAGVTVNLASQTLNFVLAAAGYHRYDLIVANYTGAPGYERIAGVEVLANSAAGTPAVPADRLFVRFIHITDGAAAAVSGVVKTVNGIKPDSTGNVSVAMKKLLIGYADDASGLNWSTSPAGKKYRAEYIPADNDPNPLTFTPALAAGKWYPFSLNKTSGVHVAPVVDMNIDYASAADFTGTWNISEFTNVILGSRSRIKRKSLNTTYAQKTGTVSAATGSLNTLTGVGTLFSAELKIGDSIIANGVTRTVSGINNNTSLIVSSPFPAEFSGVTFTRLMPDAVSFVSGTATINGAASQVVTINVFGLFVEGLTNIIEIECVSVSGAGTPSPTNPYTYEFNVIIS